MTNAVLTEADCNDVRFAGTPGEVNVLSSKVMVNNHKPAVFFWNRIRINRRYTILWEKYFLSCGHTE